jgi:PAS domain S-box-containing protein
LRRRAEYRLRAQPKKRLRLAATVDTQRILHELQVHQIELELQNEELKQSKAEVEAGLEKYTDLYDFAPVGYFSLDERGRILDVNLTGAALLGLERSRVTDRRFQIFVTPPSRSNFHAFLGKVFEGHAKPGCEVVLLNERGPAFWADLQATSATAPRGAVKWCRVTVIDVTARKQVEAAQRRIDLLAATNRRLEEEIVRRQAVEVALTQSEQRTHGLLEESRELQKSLRHMSHQILQVQEDQRKDISRELHDRICQLLIGIRVHLMVFTQAAAIDPKGIQRRIAPLRRLVEKSVRTVHQFSRDLRPALLDDLGLAPALRAYINEFPKRKGRQIRFTAIGNVEELDTDKRTVLYRVAQEALVNVARHARAKVVQVSVRRTRANVCLEVVDDGKAFDVGRLGSSKWSHHLGVMGMRERVEMVGGRFTVEAAPGVGTTIRAEVPVGKPTARRVASI